MTKPEAGGKKKPGVKGGGREVECNAARAEKDFYLTSFNKLSRFN